MENENENNTKEMTTVCSMCGNAPSGMLLLLCEHNLCLPCAASNLRRETQKGTHQYQVIIY